MVTHKFPPKNMNHFAYYFRLGDLSVDTIKISKSLFYILKIGNVLTMPSFFND